MTSEHEGYDYFNILPSVIEMVPESVARENIVIPLTLEDEALVLAVCDPMAFDLFDKLRFILNRDIRVVIASHESIQTTINRHYGRTGPSP